MKTLSFDYINTIFVVRTSFILESKVISNIKINQLFIQLTILVITPMIFVFPYLNKIVSPTFTNYG